MCRYEGYWLNSVVLLIDSAGSQVAANKYTGSLVKRIACSARKHSSETCRFQLIIFVKEKRQKMLVRIVPR